MDNRLKQLVDDWLAWDRNETTRAEVEKLLTADDYDSLCVAMDGNLSFGTAGVRTRMGAGFARLNDLTVIQLSHGMARHLTTTDEPVAPENRRAIVVGFDGRYNSRRFAELATNVLIQNEFDVFLFSEVVPTPVLSFAVVALGCGAGLMITASHNPKEDNGYKVYWRNGAQILSPHDSEICRLAKGVEPNPSYWDTSLLANSTRLHSADPVLEKYFASESRVCCYNKELNAHSKFCITYSAFHGVGSKFARRMFKEFGFPEANFSFVKEQDEPNPDFPTVPFPNPEEGHRVLQHCFATADENQAGVVLANDPDADRLQLAEKQPDGHWQVFTGNEMGALLTWWVWTNWRRRNPEADLSQVYVLNSAVSSQIVATMAKKEGFRNLVSLTGFKWIGNLAYQLRSEGKTVILAWEESIGFVSGTTLDKDGVSAAAVFAELASWLRSNRGLSLRQQLFKLYTNYGFHLTRNSYWIVPSPDVTKTIFAELRKNYPEQIGQSGAVIWIRDLTTGYDNAKPDHKAILPLSTTSEMITFTLENGSIATLRASGTEPKIKYYIELLTESGKTENDLAHVKNELDQMEADVVQTLLQPKKYGLISRGGTIAM